MSYSNTVCCPQALKIFGDKSPKNFSEFTPQPVIINSVYCKYYCACSFAELEKEFKEIKRQLQELKDVS